MALVQLAAASSAYKAWRRGSEAGASPARAQRPRAAAAAADLAAARVELATAAERLFVEAARGEALCRLGGGAPEVPEGDARAAAEARAQSRRASHDRARDALEHGTVRLEAGEARLRAGRATIDRRAESLGATLGACEALVVAPELGSTTPDAVTARLEALTGARVVGVADLDHGAVAATLRIQNATLVVELAPDPGDARRRQKVRAAHLAHACVDVADVVEVARREPPPEDFRLVVREARARVRRYEARAAEVRRLEGVMSADAACTALCADGGDYSAVLAFPPLYPDHGAGRFVLTALRAATDAAAVSSDAAAKGHALRAMLARGDAVEEVLGAL